MKIPVLKKRVEVVSNLSIDGFLRSGKCGVGKMYIPANVMQNWMNEFC